MKEKKSKFIIILGGVALTIFGFIIIPPLVEKFSSKVYKSTLKKERVELNDLGPEIVKKDINE